MSRSPVEYLRHMLDETSYLIEQSRGLTKAQFVEDETLKRAFVRSIEVIGEASKKLPEETKRRYPQVEWRAVAGMRDRLIHGYFETDYDIVWDVVVNKVPVLQKEVVRIVREESRRPNQSIESTAEMPSRLGGSEE